ncbi:MAG TPA: response regulator [Candidatus Thermoplasmatota archaeon]|nr:response regulator [Candidatus Thermoplasmatota archaeon]
MTRTTDRTVHILLVEDNPGDAELVLDAFATSSPGTRVSVARDGLAALRHLHDARTDDLPDLVLLDLHLPKKSGLEVLVEIKSSPRLRSIPVLVLSSSKLDTDIAGAYAGHANSYLPKPVGLEKLAALVRSVEDYWLQQVRLPPRGAEA